MAPFNWFNRQLDDKSPSEQTNQAEQPTEAKEKAQAQPQESEPASAAPPSSSTEDYLNWAKSAYENIRKRQQEESATTTGGEAVEPTSDSPAPQATGTPTEGATITEGVDPESTVTESNALERDALETTASTDTESVSPATLPESPASEPKETPAVASDASAASESAATALPFWAKAEAERLERLERLRIEAEIAEAEAAPAPSVAEPTIAPAIEPIPDFVLDEAFLWSAEVLAAQGRQPDQISIEEITWLKQLRQGLDKTRRGLVNQLRAIVGQGPLNQAAVMEIESLLLQADVGIEATDYIVESLQNRLREEALPPAEAIAYLKGILRDMLDKPLGGTHSLTFVPEKEALNIWLITGVNGAGKTTTIGKLAHIAKKSGYECLIAAADTFRAAAVQQVKVWGERSEVEVIANPGKNTDPAAVVFDAISAAQSRKTELLLVDTAGRLQNKKNLMDELSKIRRIIDKKAPDANVESLLVLDATLGQNGLRQAEVFSEVAKLSGVVLTKLDGTAKGGVALAVVQQLGLPIRFIGAGEGIEDLRPFSSYEFVEALLSG
ncbi:MAG: signal recognition particle-docking protein FtsY [Elainellaceae cyanobacterium]